MHTWQNATLVQLDDCCSTRVKSCHVGCDDDASINNGNFSINYSLLLFLFLFLFLFRCASEIIDGFD